MAIPTTTIDKDDNDADDDDNVGEDDDDKVGEDSDEDGDDDDDDNAGEEIQCGNTSHAQRSVTAGHNEAPSTSRPTW